MTEFQVRKDDLTTTRIVTTSSVDGDAQLAEGEILVQIDRFSFTANNITYAVVGEQLGYWRFFPPAGDDAAGWGLIPVWGFADVVRSNVDGIPVGDRLFGYFPPATHVRLTPTRISAGRFVDGAAHRAELPAGYNTYRRVGAQPGYDKSKDAEWMLFYPLHVTSFCLWDALKSSDWYAAEQVIIVSASSKTAIGLAYGLDMDDSAPAKVAVTSGRNRKFVDSLGLYDTSVTYDSLRDIDASTPAVIVDMSGNDSALQELAEHLGDNMKFCLRVGVTHRDAAGRGASLERSAFFFAPSHVEQRMKDWGPDGFLQKSTEFIQTTSARSRDWLRIRTVDGVTGLEVIFSDIANGRIAAAEGLIVDMQGSREAA